VENLSVYDPLTAILVGDAAYSTDVPQPFDVVDEGEHNNMIWTPDTDGETLFPDLDWVNSYGVQWLPAAVGGGSGKG